MMKVVILASLVTTALAVDLKPKSYLRRALASPCIQEGQILLDKFTLSNPTTDQYVADLNEGYVIPICNGNEYNIAAMFDQTCVGYEELDKSIDVYLELYKWDATTFAWVRDRKRREDIKDFFIFGDNAFAQKPDIFAPDKRPLEVGRYRIEATPYAQGIKLRSVKPGFTQQMGPKMTVEFTTSEGLLDSEGNCNLGATATTVVSTAGGSVNLASVATVTFSAGVFSTDTHVLVEKTTDPVADEIFSATAAIFLPSARLNYEVTISVDTEPSESVAIDITMDVPSTFLATAGNGSQVEIFSQVSQGSDMEGPFPVFLLLDGSTLTADGKIVIELPRYAFSLSESSGEYVAIITLAPTPGRDTDTSRRQLDESTGECQAASIACPLDSCDESLVSSGFGWRHHPVHNTKKFHTGVDFAVPTGDPIYAVADGVIKKAGFFSGYGNEVNLQHTDGSMTLYAHMSVILVTAGTKVNAGDKIGEVGTTGTSTGPHLHFTYAPNGQLYDQKSVIDPMPCLKQLDVDGAITVGDTGYLADDSFQLTIDGAWIIGTTGIGDVNPLTVSNIRPGTHQLTLKSVVAPDDIGTFYIELKDGWTFFDGSTTKDYRSDGSLSEGEERTWSFSVPGP